VRASVFCPLFKTGVGSLGPRENSNKTWPDPAVGISFALWTNFSNLVSTLTHDAWADTDVAAATLGDAGPRGGALGAGAGRAAN
jgi:hypothetical protein